MGTNLLLARAESFLFRAVASKQRSGRQQRPARGEGRVGVGDDAVICPHGDDVVNGGRASSGPGQLSDLAAAQQLLRRFARQAKAHAAVDSAKPAFDNTDNRGAAQAGGIVPPNQLLQFALLSAVSLDAEGDLEGAMTAMVDCARFFRALSATCGVPAQSLVFRTLLCDVTLHQIEDYSKRKTTTTVLQAVRKALVTHQSVATTSSTTTTTTGRIAVPAGVSSKILAMLLQQFAHCDSPLVVPGSTSAPPPPQVVVGAGAQQQPGDPRLQLQDVLVRQFRNIARIVDDYVEHHRLSASSSSSSSATASSSSSSSSSATASSSSSRKRKGASSSSSTGHGTTSQRGGHSRRGGAGGGGQQQQQQHLTVFEIFVDACSAVGRSDIAVLLAASVLSAIRKYVSFEASWVVRGPQGSVGDRGVRASVIR